MCETPNELIRQHLDTGGWYDLETKEFKYLEDTIYICAT
jgi:dynein heavy chain